MGAAKRRGTFDERKASSIAAALEKAQEQKRKEQEAWDAMSNKERADLANKRLKTKGALATMLAMAELIGVYPYKI